MNLITVYDYDEKNIPMKNLFLCWMHHVNQFAKNFNLYLIYGDKITEENLISLTQNEISNINVTMVKGNVCPIKHGVTELDTNYHVNFNLYNVMQVAKSINQPFIYIDLDAILLSDLSEWWNYIEDKTFIGTSHYPIGRTLNAGVYSISDVNKINYEILIEKFYENRDRYREIISRSSEKSKSITDPLSYVNHETIFNTNGTLRHSGDQALYANYFILTEESPYYEKHGTSWNVFASRVEYDICREGFVEISNVTGGNSNEKIKILHAYSFAKRPLLTKISNSEYYQ